MAKVALYVIGIYGLLGAAIVYLRRKQELRTPPVRQLAAQLQQAWADHHTRA